MFDSFIIGFSIAVALSIAALFIGDLIAPRWQKYYGLEGTTCTTMIHIGWTLPFAWVVNKIIDYIPGLNKLDVDLNSVQNAWVSLVNLQLSVLSLAHYSEF